MSLDDLHEGGMLHEDLIAKLSTERTALAAEVKQLQQQLADAVAEGYRPTIPGRIRRCDCNGPTCTMRWKP